MADPKKISELTAKSPPVDNDAVPIFDSAQALPANQNKKVLWSVIKSTLKTYFDGLYTLANLGGLGLHAKADTAGNADTVTNGVYTTGAGTVFQPPPSAGSGPITSSSTPTPAVGTTGAEIRYNVTALATGATFGAPTGTPVEGQVLKIKIKDNATAQTLAWNSGAGGYLAGNQLPLPTTTILSELMLLNFTYDSIKAKWLYTGALGGF